MSTVDAEGSAAAGGCRSRYLDAEGRYMTLWPDSVQANRRSAHRARRSDDSVR